MSMADVNPGHEVEAEIFNGLVFPKGYSTRVTIAGGNINNVYGGNDISGTVYGGCAVGIHSSIKGDVYGGGNGSYVYTDNATLGLTEEWGDYYYDVKSILGLSGDTFTGLESAQALNKFRPNAEKVTVRLVSDDPDTPTPTIIGGAVYCGGNSATLRSISSGGTPTAQLKIGSYVYADKVFLGSNGENMVTNDILKQLKEGTFDSQKISQINLLDQAQMNEYMRGCEMGIRPEVIFDQPYDGVEGHVGYIDYSTYIGSFFCGGNIGSVNVPGMNTLEFTRPFVIFDKLVGGCNNAFVPAGTYNASYDGGLIANPDPSTGNKLTLNLADLRIQPMRWKDESDKSKLLEWNTFIGDEENDLAADASTGDASEDDMNRRFKGGNVYGGCFNSGHINGNIIININHTLMDPDVLFDKTADESSLYGENILTQDAYTITERRTGVILGQQGMDVLGTALNVYGGGKGKNTEIWGSTTINLNAGYVFQIFGGSEEGAIGMGATYAGDKKADYTWESNKYYFNGKEYTYDSKYSCTVNLNGDNQYPGVSKSITNATPVPDMSDCEFIYGGGFLGPICGNTTVNLGNGRIFNSFAGSCNADILGHTETYMGRGGVDGEDHDVAGFPFVRDYVYGGNDLGGRILGTADFTSRVRSSASPMMQSNAMPKNVSSYVEYSQGYAIGLFGGCFGTYDYTDPEYRAFFTDKGVAKPGYTKPRMEKAFVNFRPLLTDLLKAKATNTVNEIYGAGQGYPGDADRDIMQHSSYVLIDIPQEMKNYKGMEVWGAGAWSGLGMTWKEGDNLMNYVAPGTIGAVADNVSAIIDLTSGQIAAAYGGSYQEGVTRRTIVNVPTGSTIKIGSIFGGGYGTNTYMPCDVYEANVNWQSENAVLVCDTIDKRMKGAIFGGNNLERRTLYGRINIETPVNQDNYEYGMTFGNVFGAGCGGNTWAEYTEVNLYSGAKVFEVYGGGQAGKVHNAQSTHYYTGLPTPDYTWPEGYANAGNSLTDAEWKNAWKIGDGYDPLSGKTYWENTNTNLANPLVRTAEMDERDFSEYTSDDKEMIHLKYNTNVIINEGATVVNYAYGGGLGSEAVVAGTTYVALLGGTVKKDIYAAGTSGAVMDMHGIGAYSGSHRVGFIASTNAYIEGGTARNVYGGGWQGSVGRHMKTVAGKEVEAGIGDPADGDVLAETHVVIGKIDGTSFIDGIPAIERNVYGGGEGGAVYGTTNVKMHNGYVGYRYFSDTGKYEKKIDDETAKDGVGANNLYESGCIFGGGYIDNSSVDITNVTMDGGQVRNSIFGGGEVAAVGRGVVAAVGSTPTIVKAGKTNVTLWEGHVERNVFGGGRGYNNLNDIGSLHSDGFVFGQTEVNVYGGEVGTAAGLASGYGNVFGGGDVGYVYGAYQYDKNGTEALGLAKKSGSRYDNSDDGYYYQYENGAFKLDNSEKILTEDCKVLIEPRPRVKTATTVNSHPYAVGEYVLTEDLNHLKPKNDYDESTQTGDKLIWDCLDDTGIIIHNAVFAGGNTAAGSTLATAHANTPSVFGNATASINDVYHRDLITLGTGYTGGLYGDGNLTLVDGYRELNITNYGTDYYTIAKEISIGEYEDLPAREAAYYELKYTCLKNCKDKDGNSYYKESPEHPKASTITSDDLMAQFLIITGEGANKTYVSVLDDNGKAILVKDGDTWIPNTAEGTNYWKKSGVLPVYAGRLMNSIQRADFCGVFGSRMVLQGAQDRVPEIVDYKNYTINRVREVSLNQQHSVISSDLALKAGKTAAASIEDQDPDDYQNLDKAIHGNYFGIYNTVNFLGALTSDVHFNKPTEAGSPDKRRTDNTDTGTYGPEKDEDGNLIGDDLTYYAWKAKYHNERKRNNGTSFNKVALASGVYLELTSEKSTGNDLYEKDWGYITGVVELDLINVQTGLGGGFVYAKNEHRLAKPSGKKHTTLTALNEGAVTRKWFDYDDATGARVEWETSGNFVHSTQTIIDDCYNISNRYMGNYKNPDGSDGVPAHYWYIKGSVYVYDQYISAYTGAPNAYSETVEIPLTIAAAAHGTMKLLDVRPNMYAYYSSLGNPLNDEQKLTFGETTYYKNDPISYWDWYLLSKSEKELFVEDTYYVKEDCKIGETAYTAGTVLLKSEYSTIKGTGDLPIVSFKDEDGNYKTDEFKDFNYFFRPSNNMSHDTGYMLTYRVNNPEKWNTWYTQKDAAVKNQTGGDNFEDGPTYRLISNTGAVLGQKQYKLGELISQDVETTYQAMDTHKPSTNQATFAPAYLVTQTITTSSGDVLNQGFAMPEAEASSYTGSVERAYIVTKTIQLDKTEFITLNTKMTESEKNGYLTRVNGKMNAISSGASELTEAEIKALSITEDFTEENKNELLSLFALKQDITNLIQPAYYCTTAVTETNKNLYGGRFYEAGKNYRGLEAWSSMSETDRNQFIFNYDAFDLLIDPSYSKNPDGTLKHAEGEKYQYDAVAGTYDAANLNPAHYSLITPVDYTATYNNESSLTGFTGTLKVKHSNGTSESVSTIVKGDELVREEYEKLPNEQRHYSGIIVKDGTLVNGEYKIYVVNTSFQYGSSPYAVGTVLNAETYNSLSSTEKDNITTLTFPSTDVNATYYYCREQYKVANYPVRSISGDTYASGSNVPVGTVIANTEATEGYNGYSSLPNMQRNFTIHGISPMETSTLYVSRESDIFNLSKDKIITVIYQYDYEESDTHGNITPVSERHVVNIHVKFESGVPSVEDIQAPQIVLPGSKVGLQDPHVTPGAYELTGSGWELFQTKADAESHSNGVEYTPATDLLYYYQNGYYVAYYAKTYLGKTYSNHVPVSVANYHDLKKVMDATTHHYYIDHKNVHKEGVTMPKIYINDYSTSSENGLDKLKDLFDLSLVSASGGGYTVEDGKITGAIDPANSHLVGHTLLNNRVRGCNDLEFFLRTDIDHSGSWTPIGTDAQCFEGTLHGDGYTISGLDNSLFHKLCGAIYNLGVTGTFNTAGIVDTGTGYVESCWIKTSNETVGTTPFAVFGNPTADSKWKQVVNCYYPESNSSLYRTDNCTQGNARMMPDQSFYNGEVAFDLNDFYLNKRYHDQKTTSGEEYYYFKANADGTLPTETVDDKQITKREKAWYPTKAEDKNNYYGNVGYVEDRYADGDFIYAEGVIPDTDNERFYMPSGQTENTGYYYPIWPDDYLFFGQRLHYGYGDGMAHQNLPAHINKNNGRLSKVASSVNRVYRAPAYFRDSVMCTAYYNPDAYFAAQSSDGDHTAYPDMTAIDFTGGKGDLDGGYALGMAGVKKDKFYPPLLDNDGLTDFHNIDLTQNLLAYTPDATEDETDAATMTNRAVTGALPEPVYTETHDYYRTVAAQAVGDIIGHAVVLTGGNYMAQNDHFLVDKNDFNAPISYKFADVKRMWYQRTPENDEFVDRKKGWSAISLPFSAELVTTQTKGEITHFYDGSAVSKNDTGTKIGHEYWLRQYRDITGVEGDTEIQKARMTYPLADDGEKMTPNKTVRNTFLWDYYYYAASHQDRNQDFYQTYYENDNRQYPNYNLLTRATPYIIGFPGVTYYEFDLSGSFDPQNTYSPKPGILPKQTITFASNPGITIAVSDTEKAGVTYNGYTFCPSYLNEKFKAGTDYYTLYSNYDGNSSAYKKVPASGDPTPQAAFRPFFFKEGGVAGARGAKGVHAAAKYIIFDDNDSEIKKNEPIQEEEKLEDLIVNGGTKVVVVKSNLREEKEVNIVNVAGVTLATFTIQPGETVNTNIAVTGVYIVRTTDGRYTKKVLVR